MENGQPRNSCPCPESRAERRATRASIFRDLLRRFHRDRSGSYVIIVGLAAPVMVGLVGLGTEYGLWMYTHQTAQSAADAAAFSAAQAYSINGAGGSVGGIGGVTGSGQNVVTEANAIAASFGFTNGQNGVTVTVHRPPSTGAMSGAVNGVEVIISQTQSRLFSALWNHNQVTIKARSVALGNSALGCVLALDRTVNKAALNSGGGTVNLNGCDLYDDSSDAAALYGGGSSIVVARQVGVVGGVNDASAFTTTQGLLTHFPVVPDPYYDVNVPSFAGCDKNNFSSKNAETINPGVYCNGMQFNAGTTVTFNPGVYYVDGGSFQVNGGASLLGTGVTIILTSSTPNKASSWATASINGGATLAISAPTSGALSGLVFFGDRRAPVGTTQKFNGGMTQVLTGAVYFPTGAVQWSGGAGTSTNCTQVIGDTVNFTGGGALAVHCQDAGTRAIGLGTSLVEG
jgi:Flp pilus assembly protein TadG